MEGTTYVAKRFYNIGGGTLAGVTPSQNYQNLYQEVCRAFQGQWFLESFYKLVRERDIEADMCSSSMFISSDVTQLAIDSDSEPEKAGAYWLIEPRRATSVHRWSGTMSHPAGAGQKAQTMSAFAHFVYRYSNSQLVAADLQSTVAAIDNAVVDVVFDMMTHTQDGNSGVGDHGQEGIDAFVKQHECNRICMEMSLSGDNSSRKDRDSERDDSGSE
ncbi:kinase-like domain-containing protein [Fomitopsis serialis]|uniref:kinase-like domain-containing protein n=1 Tax=Fomitopsis serialis TaxID=139415 RepID=UPI0020077791|nr:kinase-like domain-containing protein [Neoantrodia serialis]KAH9916466.1 kinase-like domain-containing protein [Neoantrodia serialis]